MSELNNILTVFVIIFPIFIFAIIQCSALMFQSIVVKDL